MTSAKFKTSMNPTFETVQSQRMTLLSKVFLMAGLISVFAAALSVIFVPNYTPWAFGFMIATAVSFVLWIITAFPHVKSYVGRRSTKLGLNSVVMTLVAVAILIGVNFVAHNNEVEKDMTSEGLYSLSDQTLKLLKNLNQDVHVTTFLTSENEALVLDALKQYGVYTNKLDVRRVDLMAEPQVVKQYNIKRANVLVFESMDRESRVDSLNPSKLEEQLTNAIVKVTKEGSKNVCFLSGHGELELEGLEEDGLSDFKERLSSSRYVAKPISLLETDAVPEDCAALFVVGPQKALFGGEEAALKTFINQGGKTAIFLDPYIDSSWEKFVAQWGVDAKNMVIVEHNPIAQAFGGSPVVPTVLSFDSAIPFVKDFKGPMALNFARPVSPATKAPEGLTLKSVGNTTDKSWGETTDLRKVRTLSFNKGQDVMGPVSVAVHVSGKSTEDKDVDLVVFGDSDFVNNSLARHVQNSDMALNIVAYFAQDEDLVSIRPKDRKSDPLELSQFDLRVLFGVTIILLPLMLFFAAGTTYLRRKSK